VILRYLLKINMGRPRKNTVDYFPHFCQHSKTMYILEQRFGNNGYTFWFKLLEELGNHEGHFIDLREESEQEFLAAKTRLSVPEILKMLNLLAKLEAIDKELWKERVIWCAKFVDNIADAYKKRNSQIPTKPFFPDENPVSGAGN
jgi:hypothetical protein